MRTAGEPAVPSNGFSAVLVVAIPPVRTEGEARASDRALLPHHLNLLLGVGAILLEQLRIAILRLQNHAAACATGEQTSETRREGRDGSIKMRNK